MMLNVVMFGNSIFVCVRVGELFIVIVVIFVVRMLFMFVVVFFMLR